MHIIACPKRPADVAGWQAGCLALDPNMQCKRGLSAANVVTQRLVMPNQVLALLADFKGHNGAAPLNRVPGTHATVHWHCMWSTCRHAIVLDRPRHPNLRGYAMPMPHAHACRPHTAAVHLEGWGALSVPTVWETFFFNGAMRKGMQQ